MTKLTETQSELLRAATLAEDSAIDAPDDAKASRPLVKQGLFIALPQTDGPNRLMITDAGREAIDPPTAPIATPLEPEAPSPSTAELPAPTPEPRPTKIQAVVALLRRPEGARIEDIMEATSWQAHSVRGAMSGAIKKGLGLVVSSEKIDDVRVYRIDVAKA